MDIPTYLKQHAVSEDAYHQIRNSIDQLRETLTIDPVDIIVEKEDVEFVHARLTSRFPQAVGVYSGSKRVGYQFAELKTNAKLSPQSFLGKSCEHPEYLLVLEMVRREGEEEIEQAISVGSEVLLTAWGKLPMHISDSYG